VSTSAMLKGTDSRVSKWISIRSWSNSGAVACESGLMK
jgi:hypothetical protein